MTDAEIRDMFRRHEHREITEAEIATFRRQAEEYDARYQAALETFNREHTALLNRDGAA